MNLLQKSLQKPNSDQLNQAGPLIVLLGQTASGKSSLGMAMAEKYQGEIICADSRTMYRGMDIGTAKPSQQDRHKIQHYLLDIVEPTKSVSAHEFVQLAKSSLETIWAQKKPAFLIGGSGMYIDALIYDYHFRSILAKDEDPRNLTESALHERAQALYPFEYEQIDNKNRRRLEHLIERGPVNSEDRQQLAYNVLIIGLETTKEVLQVRIQARTHQMLEAGFVDEVRDLIRLYGVDIPGLQTTGYKQVKQYLDGVIEEVDLESAINQATWQLAKKQKTWFKRNHFISWCEDNDTVEQEISTYLEQWRLQ
ncbi:MAG: tRNA (adenosine(37)-N6)-dimethylallyltransferase MiaA [bacterium]